MTQMMIQNGKYRKIVCSTIPEIEGSLPLVAKGMLDECIFGMPISANILARLEHLSQNIKIDLLIDHAHQLEIIESSGRQWDVFIKIDVGARRAGLPPDSPDLIELVQKVESSTKANLLGFYCHANHSYGCRNPKDTEDMLQNEVDCLLKAASLLPPTRRIEISIGATPTAHVISSLQAALPNNISIELHAGNFPTNDLQQVSTKTVSLSDQAVRVGADVISIYAERNEALINAGVIVLARETSGFPGFGQVTNRPEWNVVRVSQEHGILGTSDAHQKATEAFRIGERVWLWCQHSCITAAAFYVYYVVDENDVVIDTWVPWKGW